MRINPIRGIAEVLATASGFPLPTLLVRSQPTFPWRP